MLDKETSERIESFVKQNHRLLTASDMAYELDQPIHRINSCLDRLCLEAISQSEKIDNFVLEYYQKKSKYWMCKTLQIGISSVSDIYLRLGIKEPKFEPKRYRPTPKEVFSRLSKSNLTKYE